MKILALDGLNDAKLCKLVCGLLQTIPGVDYANIDYISQKLTLQLSGRDTESIIKKVTEVIKVNMPNVTVRFADVGKDAETKSEDGKKSRAEDKGKIHEDSGMKLNLSKSMNAMDSSDQSHTDQPQTEQSPTEQPPTEPNKAKKKNSAKKVKQQEKVEIVTASSENGMYEDEDDIEILKNIVIQEMASSKLKRTKKRSSEPEKEKEENDDSMYHIDNMGDEQSSDEAVDEILGIMDDDTEEYLLEETDESEDMDEDSEEDAEDGQESSDEAEDSDDADEAAEDAPKAKVEMLEIFQEILQAIGSTRLIQIGGVLFATLFFVFSQIVLKDSLGDYLFAIVSFVILVVLSLLADTGERRTLSVLASIATAIGTTVIFFLSSRPTGILIMISYHIAFLAISFLHDMWEKSLNKTIDIDGNYESVHISSEDEEGYSGETVIIHIGQTIPFDGIIVDGSSEVKRTLLSGSDNPVSVEVGDQVFCGDINLGSMFKIIMTSFKENSVAYRVKRLVLDGATQFTPISKRARRAAVFFNILFFCAVIIISTLALLFNKMEMLLYIVPAGLLMLSPSGTTAAVNISQRGAMAKALRKGIIIPTAEKIEKVTGTKTLITGFTGVITEGDCEIISIHTAKGVSKNDLIKSAAYAEFNFTKHAIAKAIVDYYHENNEEKIIPSHITFVEQGKGGVAAMADACMIAVGNEDYMVGHGIELPLDLPRNGDLQVHVSRYGVYAGTIFLRTNKKEGAEGFVSSMHFMGVSRVILATGSERQAAMLANERLKFDEIYAQLSEPEIVNQVIKIMKQHDNPEQVAYVDNVINASRVTSFCGCIVGGEGALNETLYTAQAVIPAIGPKRIAEMFRICKYSRFISTLSIALPLVVKIVLMILGIIFELPIILIGLASVAMLLIESLMAFSVSGNFLGD